MKKQLLKALTKMVQLAGGTSFTISPSINPNILHLVVGREPYDMIEAGIKKEEYRDLKQYWHDRFLLECKEKEVVFQRWDIISFQRAYEKGPVTIDVKCNGIRIGTPRKEWTCGIVSMKRCYIIQLGDIIKQN